MLGHSSGFDYLEQHCLPSVAAVSLDKEQATDDKTDILSSVEGEGLSPSTRYELCRINISLRNFLIISV